MVKKALIVVTDKNDAQMGGFEKVKAERLRDDLRGKGWRVNSDDNTYDKVVATKNEFIDLRNWLRDHNNLPEDEFLIYIADVVQLGPVIEFFGDIADITTEIDKEFKDHVKTKFTLVFAGPHSGRASDDVVQLGPSCLLICSMDKNEDIHQDKFDLQYSLIDEDFKEAAKLEREKLKYENPPQNVIIREYNLPVY